MSCKDTEQQGQHEIPGVSAITEKLTIDTKLFGGISDMISHMQHMAATVKFPGDQVQVETSCKQDQKSTDPAHTIMDFWGFLREEEPPHDGYSYPLYGEQYIPCNQVLKQNQIKMVWLALRKRVKLKRSRSYSISMTMVVFLLSSREFGLFLLCMSLLLNAATSVQEWFEQVMMTLVMSTLHKAIKCKMKSAALDLLRQH